MGNVFENLDKKVFELAAKRFGEPTSIQRDVIPKVLEGKNLLVIAPTGFGKTESALLPAFSLQLENKYKPISILYITPLKALNRDMLSRILWWCERLELDAAVRHGDTTQSERKLQSEFPPHILITTPEQIQAMLLGKKLRELLKNLRIIIIDEVHELVNNKRGVQLAVGLERLKYLIARPVQLIVLSATVGSPEITAKFIFGSTSEYEIVECTEKKDFDIVVDVPKETAEDLVLGEKLFVSQSAAAKLRRIKELVTEKKSIVFTNTRETAEVLGSRMRTLNDSLVAVHHSSLSKDVRISAETSFKSGKLNAIIATSSLELGIDIGDVEQIIHYGSPRQVIKLLQRTGRSGHSKTKTSHGIIISSEGDDLLESLSIVDLAYKGFLERSAPHSAPLDVLCNQILGLACEYPDIEKKKVYEIIKRSYSYKDLELSDFESLLSFMAQLNYIYTDGERIRKSRKGLVQYYSAISTIPELKTFKVIDVVTNSFVGNLDEEFVMAHCEPGATFVLKGQPWKVVSVEEEKIFVEYVESIESQIPAWEGELIPVSEKVAQNVYNICQFIAKNHAKKEAILEQFRLTEHAAETLCGMMKDISNIVEHKIEAFQNYVVLTSPHGNKINDTLGRYFSILLAAELGRPITSRADPYRIIFSAGDVSVQKFVERLLFYVKNSKEADLGRTLQVALPRTNMFKMRFYHNACRFGIIKKESSLSRAMLEKLISIYDSTPVYFETMREILHEKFDVRGAYHVIEELKDLKIEVSKLSKLTTLGMRRELNELALPERANAQILEMLKARLNKTKLRMVCMNCGKWAVTSRVEDIEKEPRCPLCYSKLIALTYAHDDSAQSIIKKWLAGKELNDAERAALERYKISSDMTIVYGKLAAFVMAARGVGPTTMRRILQKPNLTEEELLQNILAEERNFVKNRRFWSE